MSESIENKIFIGEENLSNKENIENEEIVRESVEWVAEILNNKMKSKNEKGEVKCRR